jgi:Protein of unknown function (DUF2971)
MRVYHLISEHWALESLRLQRLKLALLEDMNDPFELLGVELRTPEDRQFFQRELRPEMNRTVGVLCFSRTWNNPVLWSHYADKHRGLCLGFDVPDDLVCDVTYRRTRLSPDLEHATSRHAKDSLAYRLMTTKYKHWVYEDEVRLIFNLEDVQLDDKKYFVPYCDALTLKEVVIGPHCKLTKNDVRATLMPEEAKVSILRTRLAFRSYRVVRDRSA